MLTNKQFWEIIEIKFKLYKDKLVDNPEVLSQYLNIFYFKLTQCPENFGPE